MGGLLAAVTNTSKDVERDYAKIIATWKHKPAILSYRTYSGGNITVRVFTTDKIFNYLDRGTLRRFAPMRRSPKFVAKTKVLYIGSFPGQGGPIITKSGKVYVNPKRNMGGIKARNFSLAIRRLREPVFFRRVGDALAKGIR